MVTAALLSLVALGSALGPGSAQVPAELSASDVPAALRPANPSLCVRISPSHIAATSLTPTPQLLVFEWAASGHVATFRVERFASVALAVPPGAASRDLSFRVVRATGADGFEVSSAVRFDRLGANQALFAADGEAGIALWISSHGGRSLTNICSPATGRGEQLHVPVPLPAENKKRVKQRPLRRKKLPPV